MLRTRGARLRGCCVHRTRRGGGVLPPGIHERGFDRPAASGAQRRLPAPSPAHDGLALVGHGSHRARPPGNARPAERGVLVRPRDHPLFVGPAGRCRSPGSRARAAPTLLLVSRHRVEGRAPGRFTAPGGGTALVGEPAPAARCRMGQPAVPVLWRRRAAERRPRDVAARDLVRGHPGSARPAPFEGAARVRRGRCSVPRGIGAPRCADARPTRIRFAVHASVRSRCHLGGRRREPAAAASAGGSSGDHTRAPARAVHAGHS